MFQLCPPALIYLVFSIVQIIIDIFTGLINTAIMKIIVMIIITALLNILCQMDLSYVSWIIVLLPFLFMGITVTILLYAFGLDAARGKLKHSQSTTSSPSPSTPYVQPYSQVCHSVILPNWKIVNGNIIHIPGNKTINSCN